MSNLQTEEKSSEQKLGISVILFLFIAEGNSKLRSSDINSFKTFKTGIHPVLNVLKEFFPLVAQRELL